MVAASAALLLLVLISSPAAGAARGGTSGGRRAPGDSWLWRAADDCGAAGRVGLRVRADEGLGDGGSAISLPNFRPMYRAGAISY